MCKIVDRLERKRKKKKNNSFRMILYEKWICSCVNVEKNSKKKKVLNFYRTERNIQCQTLDTNEPSIHRLSRFLFSFKNVNNDTLNESDTIKIFIRKTFNIQIKHMRDNCENVNIYIYSTIFYQRSYFIREYVNIYKIVHTISLILYIKY